MKKTVGGTGCGSKDYRVSFENVKFEVTISHIMFMVNKPLELERFKMKLYICLFKSMGSMDHIIFSIGGDQGLMVFQHTNIWQKRREW